MTVRVSARTLLSNDMRVVTRTELEGSLMSVAAEIRAEIARQGTNASEIARRLGVRRMTFSDHLNERTRFTDDELVAVGQVLGVPAWELMRRAAQHSDALAGEEGCAVGPVDVTGWSEEEREALEEEDAHRASAGSESSRDYLALTVMLRQAVGEQITPAVFVDLSDRLLRASPAELRRWVEDPRRLHPGLAGGVVAAGPSPQELLDHEQACDSCWSLDDARGHLCGDEDPATHRSSVEEVA